MEETDLAKYFFVDVIFNLFSQVKSCVNIGIGSQTSFLCNVGVREGENLSPLLLSIFSVICQNVFHMVNRD